MGGSVYEYEDKRKSEKETRVTLKNCHRNKIDQSGDIGIQGIGVSVG